MISLVWITSWNDDRGTKTRAGEAELELRAVELRH